MKKGSAAFVFRLTVTLLLITAVVAAALAGVNAVTADKIAAMNAEKTRKAVELVLPGVEDFEELTREETWDSKVQAVYCGRTADTNAVCYAVEATPVGFGGALTMMVGLDSTGTVLGISIVSHSETVGVGAAAAADNAKGTDFRNQFAGVNQQVAVTKDGGTIDALSGATVTSRAVTEGVNIALAWFAAHA